MHVVRKIFTHHNSLELHCIHVEEICWSAVVVGRTVLK